MTTATAVAPAAVAATPAAFGACAYGAYLALFPSAGATEMIAAGAMVQARCHDGVAALEDARDWSDFEAANASLADMQKHARRIGERFDVTIV